MFVVNEKDFEYRFGDSGPKYLMKGPRMNYALVQFQPGQDFQAHYHNVMEENFYILEGKVDIVVDNVCHTLTEGDFIHIATTLIWCLQPFTFFIHAKTSGSLSSEVFL